MPPNDLYGADPPAGARPQAQDANRTANVAPSHNLNSSGGARQGLPPEAGRAAAQVLAELVGRFVRRGFVVAGVLGGPGMAIKSGKRSVTIDEPPSIVSIARATFPLTYNEGTHVPVGVLAAALEPIVAEHGGITLIPAWGICLDGMTVEVDAHLDIEVWVVSIETFIHHVADAAVLLGQREIGIRVADAIVHRVTTSAATALVGDAE